MERLDEAFQPTTDQTLVEREAEVNAVKERRRIGTTGDRVFGLGSGAKLDTTGEARVLSSRRDQGHSIHNTYYSMLFRVGWVGAAALAALAAMAARAALLALRKDRTFPLGVWFILSLIAAISAFGIVGDLQWGLLTGSLLAWSSGSGRTSRGLTAVGAEVR
jgi:hypothetical protein